MISRRKQITKISADKNSIMKLPITLLSIIRRLAIQKLIQPKSK
jgi:hypothetical protein